MQQLQQLPNERDSVEQEQMLSSSITGLQTAIRLEEADLQLTENALATLTDEVNSFLPCHQACLSRLQHACNAVQGSRPSSSCHCCSPACTDIVLSSGGGAVTTRLCLLSCYRSPPCAVAVQIRALI